MDVTDLLKAIDAPIGIILMFMVAKLRTDLKELKSTLEHEHKRVNQLYRRIFPKEDDSTPESQKALAS